MVQYRLQREATGCSPIECLSVRFDVDVSTTGHQDEIPFAPSLSLPPSLSLSLGHSRFLSPIFWPIKIAKTNRAERSKRRNVDSDKRAREINLIYS